MSPEQTYIIALSKAAIFDEDPPLPPEDIDWQYIWDKAYEQNISGLLASAIKKLPDEQKPENFSQWKSVMMQTLAIMTKKFIEFDNMSQKLAGAGDRLICLKGIVVKDFYPVPEFRTMGDFDLLTDNIGKSKSIFEENNYSITDDKISFEASDYEKINWEVFTTLENEFRINSEKYDNIIRENCVLWKNGLYKPNDTDFFAHIIVHAAKHILQQGLGVRCLGDIALIIKNCNINYEKIEKVCAEQKCGKVYQYIMACMRKFFGLDVKINETLDADLFLEYMLTYGVFGKDAHGNVLVPQVAKRSNNVAAARKIFFPPVKMLDYKYRYLKKYPFLLPVAWIHRVFEAKQRWGYSVKDMLRSLRGAAKYSEEHKYWEKKLGLNEY